MKIKQNTTTAQRKYTAYADFIDHQGHRHREQRGFDHKYECHEWLDEAQRNNFIQPYREMKFVDYTYQYVNLYVKPFVSDASWRSYELYLKHFNSRLKDVELKDMSGRIIQGYLDSLPYVKMSVVKELRLIKKVLAEAEATGLIERNPALEHIEIKQRGQSTQAKTGKFMPQAEFDELRAYLQKNADNEHLNYLALLLIMNTALRVGECVALKRDDIDFEKGLLRVDETYDYSSKTCVDPKTEHSNRTIPVPKPVLDRIHAWLHFQKVNLFRHGKSNKQGFVFMRVDGRLISVTGINSTYQTLQRHLGYNTKYYTHTIRHTLASLMLENPEIPLPYISRYLGHASEDVTRKYYLGVVPDHVEQLTASTIDVIDDL